MNFKIYDPARGSIPPYIEEPRLTLRPLGCAGGSDIAFLDGLLYLVRSEHGGSLTIMTADNGRTLGELHELGNLRQIEISSTAAPGRRLAAVTAREFGLYIIDVTDPVSPFVTCHYDSVEFATGVSFCGKYMFIGCRNFGVEIVDVSIPESPRHVAVIRAGEVQSLTVSDGMLYTGSWGERVVNVIDVRDITAPRLVSTIPLEGRGDGLYVRDGLLYAAFGQHLRPYRGLSPDEYGYGRGNGFAIWDISDPAAPIHLSTVLFPHQYYCCYWDMWDITLSSHYAILSHTFNGVWIYDIADPQSPMLVDWAGIPSQAAIQDMITINAYIMQNRPPILPFDPDRVSYAPVSGIAVGDGKLYIAAHFADLYEAKGDYFTPDPAPEMNDSVLSEAGGGYYTRYAGDCVPDGVTIVSDIGQVHAAARLNGVVYAACGMDGIRAFSPELNVLFARKIGAYVTDIREAGGLLYVAAGSDGLYILKPEHDNLVEIGHYRDPGLAFAQVVPAGRFIMAQADDQQLFIMDAADPTSFAVAMREHYDPGLIYHRQITSSGAGGSCFGCFWNGNSTHWYDLSGEVPVLLPAVQRKLGFCDGITGLPDAYSALVVYGGGYAVYDMRSNQSYSDMMIRKIDGFPLRGKPVVSGHILCVTDRLKGDVTICDVEDRDAPKLLAHMNFSGHPDLGCIADDCVYLPLGHQGLARVSL